MSNPDSFSNDDGSEYVTDEEREYVLKKWEEENKNHVCPSCSFKLGLHSAKQIIGCAIKDIRSVLGVENK
ncbi:MAG: hypothetical protein IIB02_09050 [Thaumarchaeota archaeon]|nr:hypothetical protein [Nitrososphaerota archaeon]